MDKEKKLDKDTRNPSKVKNNDKDKNKDKTKIAGRWTKFDRKGEEKHGQEFKK